jgi:hypothetical protein
MAGLFQSKSVVIVVDRSASMGYLEGGRSRFAAACAKASEILSSLPANSSANIVWMKAIPDAVYPSSGGNLSYLQDVLRKAAVTNEAGNVESSIKLALEMFGKKQGDKELYIVSDFQKTQWEGKKLAIPDDVVLATIKTGDKAADNQAVTGVFIEPELPLSGEPVNIFGKIENFSREARCDTVFFKSNFARNSRNLMLASYGSASPAFKLKPQKTGEFPVEISISEDSFPEDNRRWARLKTKKALLVSIVENSRYPAIFWEKALRNLPWIRTEKLSGDNWNALDDCDILMISGWNGNAYKQVEDFLKKGKSVICSPGPGLSEQKLLDLIQPSAKAEGAIAYESQGRTFHLKMHSPESKVFKIFSGGEYGDPAEGEFKRRLRFNSPLFKKGKPVFSYEDGMPALYEYRSGRGRFFLWNIELDPEQSKWAFSPLFLPFLSELALLCRTDGDLVATGKEPGASLSLEIKGVGGKSDIRLLAPDNKKVEIKASVADGRLALISEPVKNCGVYRWMHNGTLIAFDIVNFPESESDLRQMENPEIDSFGALVKTENIRSLHEGVNLWPYFLMAAFAIILIEGFFIFRAEKT